MEKVLMGICSKCRIRRYRSFRGKLCVECWREQPKCIKCGQINYGQTGEYPCEECGLPILHDSKTRDFYCIFCGSPEHNIQACLKTDFGVYNSKMYPKEFLSNKRT